MRFRAKLAPEQVSLLYSLIGSIVRLSSNSGSGGDSNKNNKSIGCGELLRRGSVLRLDENKLRLTTKGKSIDADGVSFFCELATTDGIFLEHRIQSAVEDNAIAMEIDLWQFRTALQSIVSNNDNNAFRQQQRGGGGGRDAPDANNTNTVVLKLAKRDKIPCLCLDAMTRDGVVAVHHSIPVRIMRVEDAYHHLPPRVNPPDVQLELPILPMGGNTAGSNERPALRVIAERLRSVCPHVYLEASSAGELILSCHNEGASIRTFFGKLIPRLEGCRESESENQGDSNTNTNATTVCRLKVDTKKLVACLQWQQSTLLPNISNCLLCFIENEMLVLHVTLNPSQLGFMTYYLPVHFLSPDEIMN